MHYSSHGCFYLTHSVESAAATAPLRISLFLCFRSAFMRGVMKCGSERRTEVTGELCEKTKSPIGCSWAFLGPPFDGVPCQLHFRHIGSDYSSIML